MKFLLKYASRSRPELFQKRVRNWLESTSGRHEVWMLGTFDVDDPTMRTAEIQEFCALYGLNTCYGVHRTKIEAINGGMLFAPEDWDIGIIVSDDMAATDGWDEVVATEMATHFPDLNGALWFPDGRQRRLCTLSIMGRPVYDWLGYWYHPDYKTAYCDDDFHQLMRKTNRLCFVDKPVFCHEWRKENDDALMARNENRVTYAHDKAVFTRRMAELELSHG